MKGTCGYSSERVCACLLTLLCNHSSHPFQFLKSHVYVIITHAPETIIHTPITISYPQCIITIPTCVILANVYPFPVPCMPPPFLSFFFSFSFPSSFSSSPCISSLAPPAQQDRRQSEAACGGSCPRHLNHLRSHSPRGLRRLHRRRVVQQPTPTIMGGCAHHRSGSVCMDAAG